MLAGALLFSRPEQKAVHPPFGTILVAGMSYLHTDILDRMEKKNAKLSSSDTHSGVYFRIGFVVDDGLWTYWNCQTGSC